VSKWVAPSFVVAVALGIGACASMPDGDPLRVTVAGVEAAEGEGLELRAVVKLRVQNPNDTQVDYDGVSVRLEVQDKTFATGVSDASGSVPRFGEAVLAVPVTISMLDIAREVIGAMDSGPGPLESIRFSLEGKLHGPGFRTHRFKSQGELQLPEPPAPTADSASP
jgi:LEA14-like dessication related protein